MGTQIITITKDGGISGLQRKPGQGVDLRQFGRAQIERVSEIKWHEERQRWYVEVISGALAGTRLTHGRWRGAGLPGHFPHNCESTTGSGMLFWRDYDDAVKAEVEYLDAMRVKGVF